MSEKNQSPENESPENQEDMADAWAAALEEQGTEEGAAGGGEPQAAEFDNLEDTAQPLPDEANLDVILDIPVTISMEIGRTHISIRNLLQLNQGSVVELDRLAGEPMDVLVNGTLVAHGEVVVVNEKFGIRLTDVISPAERVKKLK
jgi:flagellar motor switch protein FliN/FliY